MMKRWKWYQCVDGSVAVYHDNDLCFELEMQEGCSDTEINLIVKEFVMANQYMMNEDTLDSSSLRSSELYMYGSFRHAEQSEVSGKLKSSLSVGHTCPT